MEEGSGRLINLHHLLKEQYEKNTNLNELLNQVDKFYEFSQKILFGLIVEKYCLKEHQEHIKFYDKETYIKKYDFDEAEFRKSYDSINKCFQNYDYLNKPFHEFLENLKETKTASTGFNYTDCLTSCLKDYKNKADQEILDCEAQCQKELFDGLNQDMKNLAKNMKAVWDKVKDEKI